MTSTDKMFLFECLKLAAENIPEEFYCPECVIEDAKAYAAFLFPDEERFKDE